MKVKRLDQYEAQEGDKGNNDEGSTQHVESKNKGRRPSRTYLRLRISLTSFHFLSTPTFYIMSSHLSDIISDIIQAAERVENVLPAQQDETVPHARRTATTFDLPECDEFSFREQLASRSISSKVFDRICALYKSTTRHFRDSATEKYAALMQSLPVRKRGQVSDATFQNVMVNFYLSRLRSLQHVCLEEVDNAIARFHTDAEATAQSEGESSSSSSEDGLNVSRGLPPLATKIFEAVYARTDKITQAERDRLSEASGVPPRSVTIWVSLSP